MTHLIELWGVKLNIQLSVICAYVLMLLSVAAKHSFLWWE